jgi:hypothetical protein
MKKILSLHLTIMVLCLVLANYSNAQDKKDLSFIERQKVFASGNSLTSSTGVVEINFSQVPKRVRNDFSKSFSKFTSAKWYKVDDGFIASFTKNGNPMRSNYDLKGNWTYDLSTYSPEKLPSHVHSQVKSTYYDFTITSVDEIRTSDKTIYIVHMTDKNSWINVRVCEGDMEIIEHRTKS